MCLAPLLLIGSLFTLHPAWTTGHVTSLNGPLLEAQTCDAGVGAFAKASPAGVGAAGIQYGWQSVPATNWTLTLTPQFGVGLLDHHVPEVTSQVNFSLGLNAMVGYQHSRLALEYWHQSNAGLGDRNVGLDLITLMGGWAF